MQCELNDRIVAAIQRLKDSALKYAGNAALQDAVDVQMWLQSAIAAHAEKTVEKAPEAGREKQGK